ncbi:MAG: hypothetical protein ACRDPJ_12040 [Nocardioidaceae bacterium]
MATKRTGRKSLAIAMTAAAALLVTMSAHVPADARPSHIDPATLDRGPNPSVAYMVGDTIRDGARRVAATRLGDHLDLWTTARGYVVGDVVQQRRGVFRLVYVSRAGQKRLIARAPGFFCTTVSPSGRRIALAKTLNEEGIRTVVKVSNPDTGRLLASRRFRAACVFAVSDSRVLLTRRDPRGHATTWWWNYKRDTMSKLSGQQALRADLRHDRVVLATGPEDSFCNRVAPLSHPSRTLWRSCRLAPHAWSPDGARALVTHTYFDAAGTNFWRAVGDRTGRRLGSRLTGRLDWDAVWEDNRHFLTIAQSDRGKAAVVRCTVAGRCERASRLWNVRVDQDAYYVAPPVVLPNN